MTDKSLIRRVLAWTILPALAFGIAGMWPAKVPGLHLGNAAIASEMSQDEFEQRVRTYLLAHPEVIGEAINQLQARQGELDAAAVKAAVKAHAAEIFQDPDSPVSGNAKGEVTLVEFFDYNCPYCRGMAPLMTQAEAADPWLRIVYKEFPILGADSVFAAKAALAAARQGKYVAFHRALYQVRGHVDAAKVLETAATVGLNVERMKADMRDAALEGMLEKNLKLAEALHITGTPGFVVGAEVTTGATDLNGLQALIGRGRGSGTSTK